jgi:glutamate 5-kinase
MSINDKKRVVLKVGSALISPENNGCSSHNLLRIAQFIIHCRERGQQVVLVSSGSVAAGRKWFNAKNTTVALKRAMAAAGQTDMMEAWDKLFDFPSAQLLLTNDDLCVKERFDSFRDTLEALLDHNVLPIVNENDTVTSVDRRVGDNDNLAAMVATSIDADALIMFTDVDGLYNKNPQTNVDAHKLSCVDVINETIYAMAGDALSAQGTGGMRTKIEANNPGTHFVAHKKPMSAGLHWMTHTVKERGEIMVSEPKSARHEYQESVTSNRLISVKGEFSVGDTILLRDDEGNKIAKAKANYSSCLLNYLADDDIRSKLDENSTLLHNPIISDEHMAVLENS